MAMEIITVERWLTILRYTFTANIQQQKEVPDYQYIWVEGECRINRKTSLLSFYFNPDYTSVLNRDTTK